MSQSTFLIKADGKKYSMVLPNWESDYIQGMLADQAIPYELAMLQAMRTGLHEDDLVLDVGANIGNHSLYLATVVGCRVIAFEPNPMLSHPFRLSIVHNGLEKRITLVSKGVGAVDGKGVFVDPKPNNLGSQSLTLLNETDQPNDNAMDVIPLDGMSFDRAVKAIKIDVEGMEMDVLEGAKKLIENDRPTLFIESRNENEFCAVHNFLEDWGYVYWQTFNATPTNWYLPHEYTHEADLQQRGLEQGKAFYKLWDERQRLRKALQEAREKYRVASEKCSEIRKKVERENNEARAMKERSTEAADYGRRNAKNFKFSVSKGDAASERALGLDFSLPEERRHG